MFLNASIKRARTFVLTVTAAALCVLPAVFADGCREGARRGLELSLGVLVPSLFPLMAATNLFVKVGACARLGKLLRRPARVLFGVSGSMAPVLLLSLLGGYPVGAVGIAALRRQGAVSEQEARRAAPVDVCAGPGFVMGFVGTAVYHSAVIGRILLAAQVASVLLTGILARLIIPKKNNGSGAEHLPAPLPLDRALVEAVTEAARGMGIIGAFVTAFAALTGLLKQLLGDGTALDAAYLLLEVCTAVTRLADKAPVALIAFAVGFGGICVHCQIFAALGEVKVNKLLFFLFRIMQGLLTALLTSLGLRLTPQTATVFSTVSPGAAVYGGSVLSGAILLGVALCFFISVKQSAQQQ